MTIHQAWPDIGQFRNAIRAVKDHAGYSGKDHNGDPIYDYLKPMPKLKYAGTTKLHGTNSAIGLDLSEGEIWYQSRENIITPQVDNAGFARFFSDKTAFDKYLWLKDLAARFGATTSILVYGEWCGGNIQKGVALNQLPKMFVIFGVRVDGINISVDLVKTIAEIESEKIYNIYCCEQYEIEIDFANPELSQNKLIEITTAIEAECPWGKRFGVSGVGEGAVYRPITLGWEDSKFWMKVKGEKHANSKVKTLAPVDVEKANSIAEFVAAVVTPARCEQSITKIRESGVAHPDRSNLGTYLKWIVGDVIKEESDTAKASGIEIEKIGGAISNAAKKWFFENETKL